MRNQPLLFTIVALLVIIIGILVFGQKHPNASDETLGQKVGNTIDRATGERK